jgi:GT2 family glycosyltransferase
MNHAESFLPLGQAWWERIVSEARPEGLAAGWMNPASDDRLAPVSMSQRQHRHVSVVIPAFNGGAYVETAIRSVLAQTLQPAEIVVADDGSTDGTADLVRGIGSQCPTLQLIEQANRGAGAARNAGVRATTGDLLAFLDCDDLWYPSKLQRQVAYLAANPDCVVVGARMDYYGEVGRLRGVVGEPTPDERQADIRAAEYMPMQLSSWLVRRTAFEAAGGFDEGLRQVQDVDLLARLARFGSVHILPGESQGGYRLHGSSATSASFFNTRTLVRFVRARLAAEAAGGHLTFEEYKLEHPDVPPSRSDQAKFAFRESGVEFAQRRYAHAGRRIVQAILLDPRYAFRRLWLRGVKARQ